MTALSKQTISPQAGSRLPAGVSPLGDEDLVRAQGLGFGEAVVFGSVRCLWGLGACHHRVGLMRASGSMK